MDYFYHSRQSIKRWHFLRFKISDINTLKSKEKNYSDKLEKFKNYKKVWSFNILMIDLKNTVPGQAFTSVWEQMRRVILHNFAKRYEQILTKERKCKVC